MPESSITPFERHVLELIIDGTSDAARILQEQLRVATVSERRAGQGASIWLEFPDDVARVPASGGHHISNLGGIVVGRDGQELRAYFVLHVCDGLIHQLECICPDGPWPESPQLKRFWYSQRGRQGLIL